MLFRWDYHTPLGLAMTKLCVAAKKAGASSSSLLDPASNSIVKPSEKMAGSSGPMPKAAIEFIPQAVHRPVFLVPVVTGDYSNHPLVPHTFFVLELVISNADIGIVLPKAYNPMQYILTIRALIQRQVILFQLPVHRRQHHTVDPLPQHRHHADPTR